MKSLLVVLSVLFTFSAQASLKDRATYAQLEKSSSKIEMGQCYKMDEASAQAANKMLARTVCIESVELFLMQEKAYVRVSIDGVSHGLIVERLKEDRSSTGNDKPLYSVLLNQEQETYGKCSPLETARVILKFDLLAAYGDKLELVNTTVESVFINKYDTCSRAPALKKKYVLKAVN